MVGGLLSSASELRYRMRFETVKRRGTRGSDAGLIEHLFGMGCLSTLWPKRRQVAHSEVALKTSGQKNTREPQPKTQKFPRNLILNYNASRVVVASPFRLNSRRKRCPSHPARD